MNNNLGVKKWLIMTNNEGKMQWLDIIWHWSSVDWLWLWKHQFFNCFPPKKQSYRGPIFCANPHGWPTNYKLTTTPLHVEGRGPWSQIQFHN
jgi:hypothetical protein